MHLLLTYALVALAVSMMVEGFDLKFARRRCEVCKQRGDHLVGCPGRRGY